MGADRGTARSLEGFEKAADDANLWEHAVTFLRDALDRAPESAVEAVVALHDCLGRVLRQRMADAPAAIPHYQAILELDPAHTEALASLEESHGF